MAKLTLPAARVRQGSLTLFATSLKIKDLLAKGFYSVETLDPEDPDDSGYQRLLNKARAKKLADYILKGQDTLNGQDFMGRNVVVNEARPREGGGGRGDYGGGGRGREGGGRGGDRGGGGGRGRY